MTSGSGFGGRLLASFPTDIRAGGGIGVSKAGLATRVSIDMRNTQRLTTIPANGLVPVQDPLTGLIGALPVTALPTAQTGDGTQTNAKLATMPARTFKANLLNTTAPPQDVNFLQVLEALGITSGGSVATTATNVSVVPPSDKGYTNLQGAITSIEAGKLQKDKNLTDLPDKVAARTALALGAAALLAVGVAGGVASYDDPRFSFVPSAYGYTDPKAFGAKGDGVTDDSAAWQAAVNTGKVVVPSEGDYLINTTVNLPNYATIHRDGHGLNRKVKIRTTANVTTFNATGNDGSIKGIAFYHTGAQGQCFKQNNYGSWVIQGNYFEATNNGSVASDIIHTSGALSYYTFNFFNNFRNNPDSFCIAFDKSPVDPNHCIENHVDMNYAGGKPGGSGPFLYIGSRVGRAANAYNIATKPEGIHVSFNSVQTHTYSVVVECVLLLHLNANSFCIGGGIVMLLRPTGPGIIDLRAVSNWYDSTDAPNVGGVIHNDDSYRNGPAAVIKGVRFMDRFDSGKYGALFGPNASGIDFTGSHFQSMTEVGILCDGTQNVTIGSDFESCGASVQLYDRANGGPFFLARCNFSNSPPSFIMTDRSKFIMS